MRRATYRAALGGALCAFSVAVMMFGSFFPLATFTVPAAASITVLYFAVEYGKRFAALVYAASALLSLLLVPDKEIAFLFALLLGPYPIIKGLVEPVKPKAAAFALKLLFFNACVALIYMAAARLFGLDAITEEIKNYAAYMKAAVLLLGNITFVLYDFALTRLISLYIYRIRAKLQRRR